MIPTPPKLVRRLVVAPLVAVAELVLLVASPVLAVLAAIASPLTGGAWRPPRVLAITVVWAARHLEGMLACLAALGRLGLRRARETRRAAAARTTACCAATSAP